MSHVLYQADGIKSVSGSIHPDIGLFIIQSKIFAFLLLFRRLDFNLDNPQLFALIVVGDRYPSN